MIGCNFQGLTVMKLDEEKNKQLKFERKMGLRSNAPLYYICQCECGNIISLSKQKIKSRKIYGCDKCRHIDFNKYIGINLNKWTILELEKEKYDKPHFKCKCQCGTIRYVNCYNIINEKSKDCGCGRKEFLSFMKKDLKGMKFGKLTVLEISYTNKHGKDVYKCICDCGNECEVWSNCLTTNHTISCGCSKSKYNIIIGDILNELGYEHIKEYYIDLSNYCTDVKYIRFDVFIPSLNLAIEYDGEFHFKPIPYLNIEESILSLERTQYRDKIKDKYCYDNNIYLLRIPYTQNKNIKNIIIDTINIITCND